MKTIVMGLFSRAKKSLEPTDSPDKFGSQWFYPMFLGNSIAWNGTQYFRDFVEVPEVNAVISANVNAFANGKIKIISKTTDKEVARNEPLVRRLMEPNYYQSQREWINQSRYYYEIYGNEIIFFLAPVGMPLNVKGIFSITPEIVGIQEDNTTPYFMRTDAAVQYSYRWNGQEMPFPADSIVHINNANVMGGQPCTNTRLEVKDFARSVFWGTPKLASLQGPVRNIRAAYEARNVLIENRGALGILTNGAEDGTGAMLPLDPKMKKELQDEYKNYGLTKNQFQVIMTSLNLKWQQMAIDADKLKLFEEIEADHRIICNAYNTPYELFAANQTYENKQRAERQFYQNKIIPDAAEWIGAINRRAETMDKSWYLTIDYTHLPVFQENLKDRGVALSQTVTALDKAYQSGAITIEQYQAELSKFNVQ